MRVGDFTYESEGLRLGDGRGNRFTIALRGLRAESSDGSDFSSALVAEAAASAFGSQGFINYFGRQRFGVGGGAAPTHVVGALLARGEWEAAVRAIMSPRAGARGGGGGSRSGNGNAAAAAPAPAGETKRRSNEYPSQPIRHEAEDEARRAWLRGDLDSRGAFSALPRGAVAERAVLLSLFIAEQKNERNLDSPAVTAGARAARFSLALSRIPRNLRTMYVHALQSRLWNAAASARARERGLGKGVMEGDVILVEEAKDDDENDDDEVDAEAADAAALSSAANGDEGEESDEGEADAKEKQQQAGNKSSDNSGSKKRLPPAVRLATAADAGLPISRVVLPMLAPGILLPTNSSGAALKEAARELGVDTETCGATAEKNGDSGGSSPAAPRSHLGLAAATGGYRRLVASPSRVRHLFVAHRGPDDDLPMGELFGEDADEDADDFLEGGEEGKKKTAKASSLFFHPSNVELWVPGQPLPPDKRNVALLLRFRLPRSSYATMAVRELTKRPGWDSGSASGAARAAKEVGEERKEAAAKEEEEAPAEVIVEEKAAAAAAAASPVPPAAAAAPPTAE